MRKFYIRNISDTTILFFCFFFIYGIFINSSNQNAYTLQHAGIEALVERGTLYVDGSATPQLKRIGDVFNHDGHLYAAKQPGQFFIGAIIYSILHFLGVTYKNNFLLTSSLVTWFTSGLMTSLVVVMIYRLSVFLTKGKKIGFLISIFYGLGTMAFPYSGVTHHDVYGTFFIFASFYFLMVNHHANPSPKILYPVLAGAAAGFSIFLSILPLFIVFVEILYLLSFKRWKQIVLFFVACVISFSPLLIYNYYAFGNPLLPANIAGNFNDTYPAFSFGNIVKKIGFYLFSPNTSILVFSPITVFSFLGILVFPKQYMREKLFLLLQFLFLFSYLVMMTTVGHCQYGPRYLIPTLPFLSLGLSGYWMGSNTNFISKILRFKYLVTIIVITGTASIAISTVGALQGTMYCSLNIWAFKYYLGKIITGSFPEFPLLKISTFLLFVVFFVSLVKYKKNLREYLYPKYVEAKGKLFQINRLWLINNFYLIVIIFLAIILRVVLLNEIPNGFYSDEASIGYNAYSILKTGKDEHGMLLPLYFKAFGEYKNPVYIYSAIPFIKIFGLNEFAVRWTSALFGTLTVIFTYFLAKELFHKRVGLWAALFLAISPWHLQFSRVAFEAISLPCLFTIGCYFLLKGMGKGKYLFYSSILLAVTFYTYAPAKVFVPLFLTGFFALNYRSLIKFKRELFLSLALAFLILVPLLIFTVHGQGQSRFNIVSIFTKHSLNLTRDNILNDKYWSTSLFKSLSDHKFFLIMYSFLRNYFLHISQNFFFFKGDSNTRHCIGGMGQLYQFEGILLVIGIIFLVLRKRKKHLILLWWILIFPVPSSFTYESVPHAVRSICGLPVFQIIAALGLVSSFNYIKYVRINKSGYKTGIKYLTTSVSILFLAFAVYNIRYYFVRYYKEYPKKSFGAWSYGRKEIIQTAENLKDIDTYSFMGMGRQDIFVLFYTKYDPEKWQKTKYFDRYRFDCIDKIANKRQALIVEAGKYPQHQTLQTIFFPDGRAGYEIKEYKEKKVDILNLSDIKPEVIGGLKGSYFNGRDFNSLVVSRIDKMIDFNWQRGSPCPGVNIDNFSIRWDGFIKIDEGGEYKFYTVSDDGIRLTIDGYTIIDNWVPHRLTEDRVVICLDKGWHKIKIEYNDTGYDAIITLLWSSPFMKKEVVPSSHLSFYDPQNINQK